MLGRKRLYVELSDKSNTIFIDNVMFYIISGSVLFWKVIEVLSEYLRCIVLRLCQILCVVDATEPANAPVGIISRRSNQSRMCDGV